MSFKFRSWYALLAFDQFLNCWIGSGYCDETLSAHAYRVKGWRYVYINKLFFWQEDHCRDAYYSELGRKHLPKEYWADSRTYHV